MEAIAPSPFELNVSPSSAESTDGCDVCATIAPELQALWAKLTGEKEQQEAFADELTQALLAAGLVDVTTAPTDDPVGSAPQQEDSFVGDTAIPIIDQAALQVVIPTLDWTVSEPEENLSIAAPLPTQTQETDADPWVDSSATSEQPATLARVVGTETPNVGNNPPIEYSAAVLPTAHEQGSQAPSVPVDSGESSPAQPASSDGLRTVIAGDGEASRTLTPVHSVAMDSAPPAAPETTPYVIRVPNVVASYFQAEPQRAAVNFGKHEPSVEKEKLIDTVSSVSGGHVFEATKAHGFEHVGRLETAVSAAEQVVRGILTRAEFVKAGETADFHLRLEPPHLGPVRVVLSANEETVHLRLIVHETLARQQLETQMDSLRQRLEDAGISLGRFDVLQDQRSSYGWEQAGPSDLEFTAEMRPFRGGSTRHTAIVESVASSAIDVMA